MSNTSHNFAVRLPKNYSKLAIGCLIAFLLSVILLFAVSFVVLLFFQMNMNKRLEIATILAVEINMIVFFALFVLALLDPLRNGIERVRIRRRLLRRPDLSDMEFASTIPADCVTTCLMVRAMIANYLKVPRYKLRFEDNFVVDMDAGLADQIVSQILKNFSDGLGDLDCAVMPVDKAISLGALAYWIAAARARKVGPPSSNDTLSPIEAEMVQMANVADAQVIASDTGAMPRRIGSRIGLGCISAPLFVVANVSLYVMYFQMPMVWNWHVVVFRSILSCFLLSTVFLSMYAFIWSVAAPRWVLPRANRALRRFCILYIYLMIAIGILIRFF